MWFRTRHLCGLGQAEPLFGQAVKCLWSCNIPSMVQIFDWRLLLGRLFTRDLLINCGIIEANSNSYFPLRFQFSENHSYMFVDCSVSGELWYMVLGWLGVHDVFLEDPIQNFLRFCAFILVKRKKVRYLIQFATWQVIWGARNDVIFRGNPVNMVTLFHRVVNVSCSWSIERASRISSLVFSTWRSNPLSCVSLV